MNWIKELKVGEKSVLWKDFQAASDEELQAVEKFIGRSLPEEFRDFYQEIGYGMWPSKLGGGIYSPDEIMEVIGAPIYFVLGSLFPGSEWATEAQHRDLWLTRGEINPDPEMFTEEILRFQGISLLDLLQIGTDGSAGYQMLNLEDQSPIKYLLIYESTEIEFVSESFRDGIRQITDWLIRDN